MAESKHVVVIGAGVIGLQIACTLLESGYKVTIVAKYLPGDKSIEYTSPWAGAHWRPHGGPDDIEVKEWDLETAKYWRSLAARVEPTQQNKPNPGIGVYESIEYGWTGELPWYTAIVSNLEMLDAEKYPQGARTGFKYSSFTVNVPRYLVYLLQKAKDLGAHVIQEDLPTTSGLHGALIKAMDVVQERSSIKESLSVFVNATGLGSFKLVPDPTMFPIRGHTVIVSGEAKRITTINFKPNPEKPSEPVSAYILPRLGSNTTVIGGTKQSGNWNAEPDQATTDEILERAKPFVPELLNDKGDFTVMSAQVGLRPGRKQGVRVELEKVGEFTVCHAYGHAGAGYQNSIGCAKKVAKLIAGE